MLSKIGRSVVRYYAAVRISAGAAVTILPFDLPRDRTPIVRAAGSVLSDGFDRREVIEHAGRRFVVTLPQQTVTPGPVGQLLPN